MHKRVAWDKEKSASSCLLWELRLKDKAEHFCADSFAL